MKRRDHLVSTYAELSNRMLECLVEACSAEEVFTAIEDSFYQLFGLRARVVVSSPAAEKTIQECSPAPDASACSVPLVTSRGEVGVLAFRDPLPESIARSPEFKALTKQAALSVLRFHLTEEAQQARVLQEAELLRKALLDSISHSVRSPLASIVGSLSTVLEAGSGTDPVVHAELIANSLDAARRLDRMFGNLLELARLEAGRLQARMHPCDVQDVIGAALEQLGAIASQRDIRIQIAPEMPFVRMDFALIVQVLANLLDNALKYSPDGSFITVEALVPGSTLEIRVQDFGDGIPQSELDGVFDKFNRAGRTGESGGLGLGLSICKGLIQAHHGTIWIRRREPRGTIAGFNLPL